VFDVRADVAGKPYRREVTVVEGGEHGDRNDLQACAGRSRFRYRALEHCGPATRMDSQEAHSERRRSGDRSFDGLRDVVELEIEKDGAARQLTDGRCLVTRLDKKLEADLEHAHGVSHGKRHRASAVETGQVEREDDAR
jgi:hypothetical protein